MAGAITVEELQILITANYGDAIRGMLKMVDEVKQIVQTQLAPVQKMIQDTVASESTQKAMKSAEKAAEKTAEAVKKSTKSAVEDAAKLAEQAAKAAESAIAKMGKLNLADISKQQLSGSYIDTGKVDSSRKAVKRLNEEISNLQKNTQKKINWIPLNELREAAQAAAKIKAETSVALQSQGNEYALQIPIPFDRLLKEGQAAASAIEKTGNQAKKSGGYISDFLNRISALSVKVPSITKAFSSFGNTLKRVGGYISKQFISKIKEADKRIRNFTKMISGSLGFYALYSVIGAVTNGIGEATENLYQYSKLINGNFSQALDKAATSMQYLKNSIIAAVAPLAGVFADAVDVAVDKVMELANSVNQLLARLTGASTWTKAVKVQKEYAESATEAANAAKGMLAAFDEVNILSSGGGGADKNTPDYSSMFEEVETPTEPIAWLDQIKELIDAQDWSGLGQYIAEKINAALAGIDFSQAGQTVGKKIQAILDTVTSFMDTIDFYALGQDIAEFLNGAFASIDFTDVGKLLGQSVMAIFDTVMGFIENFDWTQFVQKISDLLRGFFTEIEFPELGEGAVAIWEALADSVGWLWNNVLVPFATWVKEDFAPVFGETIVSAIELLRSVIEQLKPVWDEVMVPIAEWAGEKIIEALTELNDLFRDLKALLDGEITFEEFQNQLTSTQELLIGVAEVVAAVTAAFGAWKTLSGVIGGVSTAIKGASTVIGLLSNPVGIAVAAIAALIGIAVGLEGEYGTLTALTDGLGETIKSTWADVKENLSGVWNHFLKPLLDSAKKYIGNAFESLFKTINTILTGILQGFEGTAEFFSGVFTADWDKICQGWKKSWIGTANVILGAVEILVNGFIDSLNWVGDVLSKVNSDWGWEISNVSLKIPTVPEYANGGVITSPTLGLIGEYAGAKSNPEIVTPQNIMYDTVVEANAPLISALYDMVREIIAEIRDKDTTVEIDGDVVGSVVMKYIDRYKRRTGQNPV